MDKKKEYHKLYYEKNKEKIQEYYREHHKKNYTNNKEQHKDYYKEYYIENRSRLLQGLTVSQYNDKLKVKTVSIKKDKILVEL